MSWGASVPLDGKNETFPSLCYNTSSGMGQSELINDTDVHLFIEKGMRGGIFYIAKKHRKANSKYMKCYDSDEENK